MASTVVPTFLVPAEPDPTPVRRIQAAVAERIESIAVDLADVTCQVRLTLSHPRWTLQALDHQGQPKTSGGDEFYVCYHTHAQSVAGNRPMAVALVQDQQDGSYTLDFQRSLLNPISKKQGHVSIHFQYTGGIGALPPPTKDEWHNGGYTQTVYLLPQLPHPPPMLPLDDPPHCLKRSAYSRVLAFGDSILEHLVRATELAKPTPTASALPTIDYGTKVATPLNPNTLPTIMQSLEESHGAVLDTTASQAPHRVALLLNSALWDILSDQASRQPNLPASEGGRNDGVFDEHLQACRDWILQIQTRWKHVDLYWLSPTAVHIHRVYLFEELAAKSIQHKIDRVRYMSESRTRRLYHLQKELLHKLHVPFLDIYDATYVSADWTLPGDGRHYRPALNQALLQRIIQE